MRETSIQLRQIPLESVLERLDCQRDKNDRKNWKTPAGRLTITDNQFYAHDLGKGGGGAIDLVMMLEQVEYKNSVHWLSQNFGTNAVISESVTHLKPEIEKIAKSVHKSFSMPLPCQQNWQQVKNYLTQTRGLSTKIVEDMHIQKKLYADNYKNAVFVLGDNQGVVLRGTTDKPFHGVRGKKLAFEIPSETENNNKIAFVESAIDAMSLRDLNFTGKIIATSGNSNIQVSQLSVEYKQQGFEIIAAYDNDRAGDAMARNLGDVERMMPKGKDWNDDLMMQNMGYSQVQELLKKREKEKSMSHDLDLGWEM